MTLPRLGAAWSVLRAEGVRAVLDRSWDRILEARRRASFRRARESAIGAQRADLAGGWPVLMLSATAPAMRLGGVQAQLLSRLEVQSRRGAVALLYQDAGAWRLELSGAGTRQALRIEVSAAAPATIEADAGLEAAVERAVALTGARTLHVEGLALLPFGSLLRLSSRGLRLVLAVHDFSLYCARPHLLEKPELRFCHWSRDPVRCRRCLGQDWDTAALDPLRWRELGRELLLRAAAVVFPSEFLRREHARIFGLDPSTRWTVIAPAEPGVRPVAAWASRAVRHVACVGWMHAHKGTGLLPELLGLLGPELRSGLRFSAYGGGDPALLRRLRGPGVRVRGYYRRGSLSALLVHDRVDFAILPSIVPESYGLALGECLAAGVPVMAFDCGAVADRVRAGGGGVLVDLAGGAAGLAAALREVIADRLQVAAPAAGAASPGAAEASCAAWQAVYLELKRGD